MKNLMFIVSAILMLSSVSCKKDEKKDKEFIVTGRLIKDCTGIPLSNMKLVINAQHKAFLTSPSFTILSTTTDGDGNFSAKINKKGIVDIESVQGFPFLTGVIVMNGDVNVGAFMASPNTSFVYRIKVNNPYNVGDTLVLNIEGLLSIANANRPLIVIPAPLKDTTFEIVTNYTERSSPSFSNIGKVNVKMEYGVVNNNHISYFEKNNLIFPIIACPSKIDTITLVVD